jgi:sulfite reductase (NADPH) hemoprotein beta-component
MGRTPRVAVLFEENVSLDDLLPTLDAMLRVYNLHGRRDNKYKARIKILVAEMGLETYRAEVQADMAGRDRSIFADAPAEYARIAAQFAEAQQPALTPVSVSRDDPAFGAWLDENVMAHRVDGYAAVTISLKAEGAIPGDATSEQMKAVADLAERHSASEIRVTHRQNLVLPWVPQGELRALYDALVEQGLAEANIGLASDIISCPGLDYCALATARSIPVAQRLSQELRAREKREDLRGITVNISGCINACGHHHAATIGILGLNRAEQENYQITLAGRADEGAQVGTILGPGFDAEALPGAIHRILDTFQALRKTGESLADVFARVGKGPFKQAAYAKLERAA